MLDRGIIKWQPFDSCFNSKQIICDLENEKEKQNLPILSEDQLNVLEEEVINAYNLKQLINVQYYYNGDIKNINGQINFINFQKKEMFLNNVGIYFKQIIKIEELN